MQFSLHLNKKENSKLFPKPVFGNILATLHIHSNFKVSFKMAPSKSVAAISSAYAVVTINS